MLVKSVLYVLFPNGWRMNAYIRFPTFFFSETLHRLEQICVLIVPLWPLLASTIISRSVCIPTLLSLSTKFYFVHINFTWRDNTPRCYCWAVCPRTHETRVVIQHRADVQTYMSCRPRRQALVLGLVSATVSQGKRLPERNLLNEIAKKEFVSRGSSFS